eukprot:scpid39528/ scgid30207/ Hypoxia up-regulated protein 1
MTVVRVAFLLLAMSSVAYVGDAAAVMSIDFGSEFIKVAIVKPGVPMEVALNKESRRKTPNVVSMRDGERLFGGPAVNVGLRFPKFAFRYLLHILGEQFDSSAVKQYSKRFPHYKLVKDEVRGTACLQYSDTETYCVEELIAMMLNNSRETAQNFAEQVVKDVVITVPAFFSQAQRRAMMYAADLVGLNVRQLMNSGSAVALNYGVFRQKTFNDTAQHLMFFDMGSTSTIATIVSYQTVKSKELGLTETVPQLTVRSVGFDRTLGGLEMDLRLRDHLATVFDSQKKTSESVRKSPRAMAKLLKEANRVKQVLSANTDHMAQIEGLLPDIDFRAKVSREEFEKMCEDVFARVQAPVEQALKAAEMDASDLEQVIIVGGGSRVPKVQQLLMEVAKKTELGKSVNSDEAAALGASYAAAGWSKAFRIKKFKVKDSNLYPLEVSYDRKADDGKLKHITRALYTTANLPPVMKLMTINHFQEDFQFAVAYCNLTHLSETQVAQQGSSSVLRVSVGQLSNAFASYTADTHDTEGVKVHFNLDASGVFSVNRVEAVFQKKTNASENQPSTLSNIVDGISSFFSGSSKTSDSDSDAGEGPSDSADTPSSSSSSATSAEASKDGSNSTADFSNSASSNNTSSTEATKSQNATKLTTIRVPLKFSVQYLDVAEQSESVREASLKRLQDMAARDLEKVLLEAAKNALEAFIFDMQDKLTTDVYTEASVDEERTSATTALSAASEWLYEEGEDATRDIYDSKLSDLKKLTTQIVYRVTEHRDRPEQVKKLRSLLNVSYHFAAEAHNQTKPAAGYVDSLYTMVEVDTLDKLINSTEKWLNESEAEQATLKKSSDPILTLQAIADKMNALAREASYLNNKAKYFVPTKKKVRSKSKTPNSTNTTTANSTTADADSGKESADKDTAQDDATSESSSANKKSTSDSKGKSDDETDQTSSSSTEEPADDPKSSSDHSEL